MRSSEKTEENQHPIYLIYHLFLNLKILLSRSIFHS